MRSPQRQVRQLAVSRLEDRVTPVVGAFDVPALVGDDVAYQGIIQFGDTPQASSATGALLTTGRHILTAAHTVDSNTDGRPDSDTYYVRFDLSDRTVLLTVDRANVYVPPQWKGRQDLSGYDFAILTLPEIAPLGNGERGLGFEISRDTAEVGDDFTFVGYGYPGTGSLGEAFTPLTQSAEIQRLNIRGTGEFELEFNGFFVTLTAETLTPEFLEATLENFAGLVDVTVVQATGAANPHRGSFEIAFNQVDLAETGLATVDVPEIILTPVTGFVGTLNVQTLAPGGVDLKRIGKNTFTAIDGDDGGVLMAVLPEAADFAILGSGDSGGPAFINGKIAGIASFGDSTSTFNTGSGWARVSKYADIIDSLTEVGRFDVTLNVGTQIGGPDGKADTIRVQQVGTQVHVTINGVLIYREAMQLVRSFRLVGTSDAETVTVFGELPFTVNFSNIGRNDTITQSASPRIAVGANVGSRVQLLDYADRSALLDFNVYATSFTGGVRVATGDLTGDGVADLVTAAGPGGGPHIRVFNGVDGSEVANFFAYAPTFRGGIYIALGDINGDGRLDLITGADAGGGPHVQVFDGTNYQSIASFFAYVPTFTGGVRVAAGDFNLDGRDEIVVGAGPGGGPHVQVFDGNGVSTGVSFFAYESTFTGGVFVSTGDLDGDGRLEFVIGSGLGGGPVVSTFTGLEGAPIRAYFAGNANFRGGVRVTTVRMAPGESERIVAAQGLNGDSRLYEIEPKTDDPAEAIDLTFVTAGGLYVG
ncbi:FG-GAP-like repeat-containing protein [Tuwongella immobilis]|uniref:Peptidase S1 domain-containing protein n=1 Tax=Tuwongella immobilis TaxID=692036 RepID=A0A6C2YJ56_9BACT|nr:FG-GAP-like repeat-containing protein [Tuwongella immobilis]VIP01012.1 na-ca exchanger integrin-beta4 : Hemolysin-type calcium-binding region domain protein OS=Rhodopirellula maiorica SM1 GN=RMSM_03614 PE=4 SV=1: Trypsin: Trypsin: VCBS [Tuwongella immobilis]VTR97448.1 na-ca exchanger integrin-beta4 : Hemolysin-type calcium-binding region domain protein OS=Rhodopirellula maiorica SM1 GN=RMSM_03614 PE=4 SV=1: Trypsin: Trypsin: VCBS [Tuwongella immobilis]